MTRALRLLLVCLLAMALPFKAVAGLTMPGCAPMPGEGAAAHAVHAEHAAAHADEGLDHADGAGAEHHHGHATGDSHGHAQGKCSNCSPCSLVAGPAPDGPVVPTTLPAHHGTAHPAAALAGVVADVPHEPPRTVFR